MKNKLLFFIVLITAAAAIVYAVTERSHEFSDSRCSLCHYDAELEPERLLPTVNLSCNSCHMNMEQRKSHPSDVYPTMTIPEDMPLTDGKLTCLTCHYVHMKDDIIYFSQDHNFLRRQVRGIFFCNICHKIDKNRHMVFENIHTGSYTVTDRFTRIDRTSLECIECHDSHMKTPMDSIGAGKWNHYKKKFNHPIGVPYRRLIAKKRSKFKPESMLSPDIRLFDGKMGCVTCHNIYSEEKNMLAVTPRGSRLCLECHIQ